MAIIINKEDFYYNPDDSQTERGKLLIVNHNKKVDDIYMAMEYGDEEKLCKMITMTEHSKTSKMAHKHSLSTNVSLNKCCQARQCMKCRDGKEPVCPWCFANAITNARPTVKYSTTRNSMILQNNAISEEVWRKVWEKAFAKWGEPDFRVQSIGDAANVTETDNFVRLEYAFPEIIFTEWSKNPNFWRQTFERLGKPRNSRYIHSSLYLNVFDRIPDWMVKYVDFRFTVFTEEFLRDHPWIIANCCTLQNKGRQCRRDCNDCYAINPELCEFDRIEIVRGYKKGEKKHG